MSVDLSGPNLLHLDNNSDHDTLHTLESEPCYLRLFVLMNWIFCTVSCRLEIYWPLVDIPAVFLKLYSIYIEWLCRHIMFVRRRVKV